MAGANKHEEHQNVHEHAYLDRGHKHKKKGTTEWKNMKNPKKYGQEHQYYHEKIEYMQEMDSLHFDDPGRADHYLKNASSERPPC